MSPQDATKAVIAAYRRERAGGAGEYSAFRVAVTVYRKECPAASEAEAHQCVSDILTQAHAHRHDLTHGQNTALH